MLSDSSFTALTSPKVLLTSDISTAFIAPLPKPEYNRSIMTPQLLPQGFAAAVLPITASTITTDSAGLVAGEVEIPSGDLRIPAYRACPAEGKSFPIILVVQEIFGIHEHIKDLCRRFAK